MSFIRREDIPAALGAAAIAVSVLSGKLGLGGELLSVRFFATLAAVILLLPELRRVAVPAVGWLLFAFLAYMVGRSFFDAGPLTAAKQIDALYFAVQIVLVAAVARKGAGQLAAATLGIAAAYLAIATFGQVFPHIGNDTKFGLGWGPVGTAITFSRIQFLGFCVAAILIPWSPFAIGLAALFLYATFASLMKAALVGSLLALALLVGLLAVGRRWRNMVTICAVSAVAFVAFQQTFAGAALNRIDNAFQVPSETPAAQQGGGVTANGLLVVTMQYCVAAADGGPDCRKYALSDASQRLILLTEALTGFVQRPIFGHGMGNYKVVTIRPHSEQPDPYFYPHNLVAEVAFEGGLIGLAGLAAAFLMLVYSIARSPAPLMAKCGVGAFVTFMLAAAMFGGDLYDSRLLWLMGIALLARWPVAEQSFPASLRRGVDNFRSDLMRRRVSEVAAGS